MIPIVRKNFKHSNNNKEFSHNGSYRTIEDTCTSKDKKLKLCKLDKLYSTTLNRAQYKTIINANLASKDLKGSDKKEYFFQRV